MEARQNGIDHCSQLPATQPIGLPGGASILRYGRVSTVSLKVGLSQKGSSCGPWLVSRYYTEKASPDHRLATLGPAASGRAFSQMATLQGRLNKGPGRMHTDDNAIRRECHHQAA